MDPKKVHALHVVSMFLLICRSLTPSPFSPHRRMCWRNWAVCPVEFPITSVLTVSQWLTYFSAQLVVESASADGVKYKVYINPEV